MRGEKSIEEERIERFSFDDDDDDYPEKGDDETMRHRLRRASRAPALARALLRPSAGPRAYRVKKASPARLEEQRKKTDPRERSERNQVKKHRGSRKSRRKQRE